MLALPARESHVQHGYDEAEAMEADLPHIYPEAFDDPAIEERIHGILQQLGVQVLPNCEL